MSIKVKNLSYVYSPNTSFSTQALDNISFCIEEGDFVGIVGSTGSGKSTLVQHLNGLLKLSSGNISVYDMDLTDKKCDLKKLRRTVGMLFQYPEYQLFEDTVLKDVCYGPINFGLTKEEAILEAKNAIEMVGLNYLEVKDKSPFELSGGEKRRVAIAGVIASKPKILVLDEPTAGLDPIGKREILNLITRLSQQYVKTVIMIGHNMDEMAEFTNRLLVLHKGKLVFDTTAAELFTDKEKLVNLNLDIPKTAEIALKLKDRGFDIQQSFTVEGLANAIIQSLESKNG